jgi:hypothetical protein
MEKRSCCGAYGTMTNVSEPTRVGESKKKSLNPAITGNCKMFVKRLKPIQSLIEVLA